MNELPDSVMSLVELISVLEASCDILLCEDNGGCWWCKWKGLLGNEGWGTVEGWEWANGVAVDMWLWREDIDNRDELVSTMTETKKLHKFKQYDITSIPEGVIVPVIITFSRSVNLPIPCDKKSGTTSMPFLIFSSDSLTPLRDRIVHLRKCLE